MRAAAVIGALLLAVGCGEVPKDKAGRPVDSQVINYAVIDNLEGRIITEERTDLDNAVIDCQLAKMAELMTWAKGLPDGIVRETYIWYLDYYQQRMNANRGRQRKGLGMSTENMERMQKGAEVASTLPQPPTTNTQCEP